MCGSMQVCTYVFLSRVHSALEETIHLVWGCGVDIAYSKSISYIILPHLPDFADCILYVFSSPIRQRARVFWVEALIILSIFYRTLGIVGNYEGSKLLLYTYATLGGAHGAVKHMKLIQIIGKNAQSHRS